MDDNSLPSWKRFVYFTSPPQTVADILCASSQTIRSQSVTLSLSCISSFLDSLSRRTIQRFISENIFPVTADSIRSLVSISKRRLNFLYNSSCHCSAKLPGETIMQRLRSPRISNSFRKRPVIIVFPAPGSSARMYRSGRRGSISL